MKRHRVIGFAFDSRALFLTKDILDHWENDAKRPHLQACEQQVVAIEHEYGMHLLKHKVQNFIDLGPLPFSIISYHTALLDQIRRAFVGFGYYPALTGACALGERILNHLIRELRGYFRDHPDYKKVHSKASFDNWKVSIDVLERWGVLLPEAIERFRDLHQLRNEVVHFRPGLEYDARSPALRAIKLIKRIVEVQFSAFGGQPWFIPQVSGESYIAKEAESWPFIREFYLPVCTYVGPFHEVTEITPKLEFRIRDNHIYDDREIADEEFVSLRSQFVSSGPSS